MARGSCSVCGVEDAIIRKVNIASRLKEDCCVPCCNAIIVFVEVMKKKKVKA